MNRDFLIKKGHLFKQRYTLFYNTDLVRYETIRHRLGIVNVDTIRFELVYLRLFKKLYRVRCVKLRPVNRRTKYWHLIKPNFVLSAKAKNSRMGSGVGKFVRITCRIVRNNYLAKFFRISYHWLKKTRKFLKLKLNLDLYVTS